MNSATENRLSLHLTSNSFFFNFDRCGGQGDLLSGTCALFLYWATRNLAECPDPGPGVTAGWAASRLSRACAVQVIKEREGECYDC